MSRNTVSFILPDQKRGSNNRSPDIVPRGDRCHSGTFDAGLGGGGIRGVEGHVVSSVFKALVTRFVEGSKEIKAPENLVSGFVFGSLVHLVYFVRYEIKILPTRQDKKQI